MAYTYRRNNKNKKRLKPDPAPPRYKPMSAVARTKLDTRTEKRYEAVTESGTGTTIKGVDASDGFSRKEAKLVKRARRYQKAGRQRARTLKRWKSSPVNPKNNPNSPFASGD